MGVLLIFFFGTYAFALISHYRVTACSNLYEDRELEILSYRDGPNSTSDDPKQIRGSILPDGIEVYTDDNSVSLMSLNDSDLSHSNGTFRKERDREANQSEVLRG